MTRRSSRRTLRRRGPAAAASSRLLPSAAPRPRRMSPPPAASRCLQALAAPRGRARLLLPRRTEAGRAPRAPRAPLRRALRALLMSASPLTMLAARRRRRRKNSSSSLVRSGKRCVTLYADETPSRSCEMTIASLAHVHRIAGLRRSPTADEGSCHHGAKVRPHAPASARKRNSHRRQPPRQGRYTQDQIYLQLGERDRLRDCTTFFCLARLHSRGLSSAAPFTFTSHRAAAPPAGPTSS